MFGKLFGKNHEDESQDEWSVVTGQDGGMPLIFRIRSVPSQLNRSQMPYMLAISWPIQNAHRGMPQGLERQRMDELEDLIMPAIQKDGNGILTVVVTGNGIREWQLYTRSPDETMKRVNNALEGQPVFPIEFMMEEDPAWKAYQQFEM